MEAVAITSRSVMPMLRHRGLAAQHRADFARELEDLTEVVVTNDERNITVAQDRSIAFEGLTVRNIAIALFRKELSIRGELTDYLGRWLIEARKDIDKLRAQHVKVQADILAGLIEFGYDDPAEKKLSPSRVLPGYLFAHPEVWAAKREFDAARGLTNGTKWIPENAREIENLRRLIRSEAARLAGLSVG